MAEQELKIWALEDTQDPVKGNDQKRTIREEEWLQGLGRLHGFTAQQINTMFNLLTHFSPPADLCVFLHPAGGVLPSTALRMNGQSITLEDQPILYNAYGPNLPDMTAEDLAEFYWVVRNH